MLTFMIVCLLLMTGSDGLVDQAQSLEVLCKSESKKQLHSFYAEITMPATSSEYEYRLQVSTEGSNGRSRQSQSGIIEVGETMPVRTGDIRVKLTDAARYECICTVLSEGVILASDTLRTQ